MPYDSITGEYTPYDAQRPDPAQQQQPKEDEENLLEQFVYGIGRGAANLGAGVANLIPGVDVDPHPLGQSDGILGGITEGISQFVLGFIPVVGWMGKGTHFLSKAAQAKHVSGAAKFATRVGRDAAAGAIVDFAAFDSNDPRLATLLNSVPELDPLVPDYFAEHGDDGRYEGRIKNVLEGAGLGVIADGFISLVRSIKFGKKAAAAGDEEGVKLASEQAQEAAEGIHMAPVDGNELDSSKLNDPLEGPRAEEEVLRDEQRFNELIEEDEVLEQEPKHEHITQKDIENKLAEDMAASGKERDLYDVSQGTAVVLNVATRDPSGFYTATSHMEFVVREPNSKMALVQLDGRANVLSSSGRKAKKLLPKSKQLSDPEWETLLTRAAKDAGYDVVQFHRGDHIEHTIVNDAIIKHRVNVKSKKPFWDKVAQRANEPVDAHIIARSPREALVRNMDMTPQKMDEFIAAADEFEKTQKDLEAFGVDDETLLAPIEKTGPNGSVYESTPDIGKLAGIANFTKMGGRGRRAFHKFVTEELGWAPQAGKSWDDTIFEANTELAWMLNVDPKSVGAAVELSAEEVNKAGPRALGAMKFQDMMIKEIISLTKDIKAGTAITDAQGLTLNREAAIEMLAQNIEDFHSIGQSVSKLRTASGQLLNSWKIGVDRMSRDSLARSLELRGGNVDHILKIASLIEEAGEVGPGHASRLLMDKAKSKKWWAAGTDWYMFSLLSAAKTITTNGLGALATAVYRPMEGVLGSWVGRAIMGPERAAELKRATGNYLRNIRIMNQIMRDTVGLRSKLGKGNFASDEIKDHSFRAADEIQSQLSAGKAGMLEGTPAVKEGFSREGLGMQPRTPENDHIGQAMLDFLFKAVKLPSRFMAGTDEFVKQVAYAGHVQAELMTQADEIWNRGGPFRQNKEEFIEHFVREEYRSMVVNGQAKTERLLRSEADKVFPVDVWTDEAIRQKQITAWIDKELADSSHRSGNTVAGRSHIIEQGLKIAEEVTFTTKLDTDGRGLHGILSKFGSTVQEYAADHPTIKLFAPFIRTPLNLLMFAGKRMPVPGLNPDLIPALQYLGATALGKELDKSKNVFMKQLTSSDPQVVSEALGRASVAMGFGAVFGAAALSGAFTGSGPRDPALAKTLKETGWQPYSMKVGDAYISYQRMDPLATVLGFWGDVADSVRFGADESDVKKFMVGYFISAITNLGSKSYLAGLNDLVKLLSDPMGQWEKTVGRISGSLLVPNAVAALRGVTDSEMADLHGIKDRIMARIPGLSSGMNKQRNALGEPVTRKTFGGALRLGEGLAGYMLPVQFNMTNGDELNQELSDLGFPFRPAKPQKYGVDLRDHATEEGQSAYDRWQELTGTTSLNGRTLRQSLQRLVRSNRYQKLDKEPVDKLDVDSPRIQMITRLMGKYRRAAERKMLQEFPDLQERTRAQRLTRRLMKQGQASSSIQSLLGQ